MKRLNSLIPAATTIVDTTVALTLPAEQPPWAVAQARYEFWTVVSLQQKATDTPPSFFTDTDANGC